MDQQPVVHKKLELRQPSADPTSLHEGRFVVIGGPDAGISVLTQSDFFLSYPQVYKYLQNTLDYPTSHQRQVEVYVHPFPSCVARSQRQRKCGSCSK